MCLAAACRFSVVFSPHHWYLYIRNSPYTLDHTISRYLRTNMVSGKAYFADAHALKASSPTMNGFKRLVRDNLPSKYRVQLLASRRDLDHTSSLLSKLLRSNEAKCGRLYHVLHQFATLPILLYRTLQVQAAREGSRTVFLKETDLGLLNCLFDLLDLHLAEPLNLK